MKNFRVLKILQLEVILLSGMSKRGKRDPVKQSFIRRFEK